MPCIINLARIKTQYEKIKSALDEVNATGYGIVMPGIDELTLEAVSYTHLSTIKVMDFGIARFSRSENQTMTDKAIGSVHYISPEQAKGDTTDAKADIYSVGVMMYEMLSGKLPFESDSPRCV